MLTVIYSHCPRFINCKVIKGRACVWFIFVFWSFQLRFINIYKTVLYVRCHVKCIVLKYPLDPTEFRTCHLIVFWSTCLENECFQTMCVWNIHILPHDPRVWFDTEFKAEMTSPNILMVWYHCLPHVPCPLHPTSHELHSFSDVF